MLEVLRWLPIAARIQYKVLFLVSKSLGRASKYISDYMQKLLSGLHPHLILCAVQIFVPRTGTALAQHRAFAVVGPSIWNDLPHP